MKKFNSVLLTIAILLALCAGALPAYASDVSISITSAKTVLMVGQSYAPTVTVTPSGTSYTLSSSNPSVVSVDNTYRTMTGVKKGTAVITATCTDSSGNVVSDSITITVCAPTGLYNNIDYFIMNCSTGLLLSLETISDVNNVNIRGRALSNRASYSQWTVQIQYNGTIRLQNVYSSAGRAIYISGTNAILYDSTGAYTRLDLHRVDSGLYEGKYLIRFNNKYLTMNSAGGVYLSTARSTRSYWCFMAVDHCYADMHATNNSAPGSAIDTTVNCNKFSTKFHNLGYLSDVYINQSAYYAYESIMVSDICIIVSHGYTGIIGCYTASGEDNGSISVDEDLDYTYGLFNEYYYINDLQENIAATARLIMYMGCNTGNDFIYGSGNSAKTHNLVDATFDKGAHCVIGLTESVSANSVNDWLGYFIDAIHSGNSIEDAISYANELTNGITIQTSSNQFETVAFMPLKIAGDSSQYLN